MKKITNSLKFIAVLALFMGVGKGYSQCTANFTFNPGSNGAMTFSSTSAGTGTSTIYFWSFGTTPPTTFTSTGMPNAFTTYTANGVYSVTLAIYNSVPACTSVVTQTVNVTNVTTPTCNIAANFSASNGSNGLVNFSNLTTGTSGGVTYSWNFGDGSPLSTGNSPSHSYTANGTYTISLAASNNLTCTSTYTAVVTVSNVCNLTPSFVYIVGSNGAVTFSSTSGTGTTSTLYHWVYGNGATGNYTNTTTASTTYTVNGVYTVTLSISGACSGQVTQTINVTGIVTSTCNLAANFTGTQGTNGTFNFNNTSTGTSTSVTYSWNFGDGSTSTGTSPAHTYTANGGYIVTLNASNNTTPACTSVHSMTIIVNSICNLNAGFSYTANSNGNVAFNNTSTGAGSANYSWHFGDGGTSNSTSPTHHYALNGTYTVMMISTNTAIANCTDSVYHVVTVTTSTCVADASFSVIPSSTLHLWYAVPTASAGVVSSTWSWGDGSSSAGMYPSHTYSAAGTYTICHSVVLACGDSATYCFSSYLSKGSGSSEVIQINVVTPEQVATGIKNNAGENAAYSVSPNPANGAFNIRVSGVTSTKASINVYNVVGTLVYQTDGDVLNGTITKDVTLDTVSGGVYFVKVMTDNKTYTKKLIINK